VKGVRLSERPSHLSETLQPEQGVGREYLAISVVSLFLDGWRLLEFIFYDKSMR